MRPARASSILPLLTVAWLGCDEASPGADAGADAGPLPDGQIPDAGGPSDSGAPDSGTRPDAGPGKTVTVDVTGVFAAGTVLRDGYGGRTAAVGQDGKVTIEADPAGVVLLEVDPAAPTRTPFTWDNATVYFVMTDRFHNGDPTNDGAYGRQKDGRSEVGTWHGGDLAGLTQKIDYFDALGVDAIWITAPVEQVHGWVGGGNGDFQHFGYHGYWALDFTKLDANLGTPAELETFIARAHEKGIRVVFDVVMNHPGYATGADLLEYLPEVIDPAFRTFAPGAGGSFHDWNQLVNYQSNDWVKWWGPRWIRAGFPMHNGAGQDDLKMSLSYLPDFMTEDFRPVPGLPDLLQRKADTAAAPIADATVRSYLVAWHSAWVRQYGVDGFRADTAKHVELASWKALKEASVAALRAWKAENPTKALDDLDFWMTGEVFPHGVVKDAYFDNGFDSLINFDFQTAAERLIADRGELEGLYASYAGSLNTDPSFNVLSYISSHDTYLFFEHAGRDLGEQADVGTALLLTPGAVQIFYGDETARPHGPSASDVKQGTRSDMNWTAYDAGLLAHWQKLGTFRRRHAAVGAGAHRKLDFTGGYAFARTYDQGGVDDRVVVVLAD